MTQQHIMGNLETWVRQLNGELNVSEVANVKAKLPDIHKPYSAFLKPNGTVGVMAVTNLRRHRPCNVEFVFDGDTCKLKDVKMINQDDDYQTT